MARDFYEAIDKFFVAAKTNTVLGGRVEAAKKAAKLWEDEQRVLHAPTAPDGTKMDWIANIPIKDAQTLGEAVTMAQEKWAQTCANPDNRDWAEMEFRIVTDGIVFSGRVMSAEEWRGIDGYYPLAVYGSAEKKV